MSRDLIQTTEQDFCGSDVQTAKRKESQTARLVRGSEAGTPLNLWQRLVLFLFVSDYSKSYESVRRHNKLLLQRALRAENSNAQYKNKWRVLR